MKKIKLYKIGGGILLILFLLIGCVLSGRIIKHEQNQNQMIQTLQDQLNAYTLKKDAEENAEKFDSSVFTDAGYNYLAIGNSITRHIINEYWWNDNGMAASTQDKDYVHLVASKIEKDKLCGKSDGTLGDEVNAVALGYSVWEIQSNDRAETFNVLDPYLSPKLDLVTVQLGENVHDTTTFEKDLEELIRYIEDKCIDAQIMVIGQFWKNEMIDNAKLQASKACGVEFIDLSDIQNKSKWQAGMGTIVYDAKGGEHVIEHEGVAAHPGDKGMEKIAEKIIDKLAA